MSQIDAAQRIGHSPEPIFDCATEKSQIRDADLHSSIRFIPLQLRMMVSSE
jgi:hypothetical protein